MSVCYCICNLVSGVCTVVTAESSRWLTTSTWRFCRLVRQFDRWLWLEWDCTSATASASHCLRWTI